MADTPEKTKAPVPAGAIKETESTPQSIDGAYLLSNSGYFANFGKTLLDNGYLIIPIKPGHKRPALSKWQNARLASHDLTRYPGHGVGVLCGQGAQPIAAIDIDTMNEALAARFVAWCQEHLGVTGERIGQAPKVLLVYRAASSGWEKATSAWFEDNPPRFDANSKTIRHRLEVLSKGQQFVAYHTHPDTGRAYQWVDLELIRK